MNVSFASKNIAAAVLAFGYDPDLPAVGATNQTSLRVSVRVDGFDVSIFADNLTNSRDVLPRSHDNVGSPLCYNTTYRPRLAGNSPLPRKGSPN